MGRGGGSSLSQCTLEITSQALKCFLGDPKCSQGDCKGNCPQDKVHQGQGLEITLRDSEVIVTLLGESAKSYLYHRPQENAGEHTCITRWNAVCLFSVTAFVMSQISV